MKDMSAYVIGALNEKMDARLSGVLDGVELTERENKFLVWLKDDLDLSSMEVLVGIIEKCKGANGGKGGRHEQANENLDEDYQ